MKFLSIILLVISSSVWAQSVSIDDYGLTLSDILDRKLNKEDLYKKMNRKLVRAKDSICSNRAHVWAWDFHLNEIDSGKIFLFFTPKTARFDGGSWWYHASPVINEKGKLWVMDAGYPKRVQGPLSVNQWMRRFTGEESKCKEIKHGENELFALISKGNIFPTTTEYGKYDCYYKITPAGYWTPSQVAANYRDPRFDRSEIRESEVMDACIESSTTPLGWMWGTTLKKCRYFISKGSLKL